MANKRSKSAHFRSFETLSDHVATERLGYLDSREWEGEWAERWVVFADLIAFASRALRSDKVVLNNIIRFDRASQLVASEFPNVEIRRFSDSTFAIANEFHTALAFGVALAHTCHAFNREYLERTGKEFFIHLIVPRITIACGQVLLLPSAVPDEQRYWGIDPKNILAGSAIVTAHSLERDSAGGLVTLNSDGLQQLVGMKVRGDHGRVVSGLERWTAALTDSDAIKKGEVFCQRKRVVDVPWLLLRPLQTDPGNLWAASREDSDTAISSFFHVWETSIREF